MATFRQIKHMSSGLDDEQLTQPHIKKLAHDIVDFGYRGAPILYIPQVAIIDGHDRLAALCLIDKLIMNARNWTPDFEAALMMLKCSRGLASRSTRNTSNNGKISYYDMRLKLLQPISMTSG